MTFDIPYVCAGEKSSNMKVSQDGLTFYCEGLIVDVIDKVSHIDIHDYYEKNEQTTEPGHSEDDTVKRKLDSSYRFLRQCLSNMAEFLQGKSAYRVISCWFGD